MKWIVFFVTITIQFLLLFVFKLLDSYDLIIAGNSLIILCGFFIKKINKLKDVGWGMLYGSLTWLALVFLFMIWLFFNWPK